MLGKIVEVSIIIPFRNEIECLLDAVNSALAFDFDKPFEIILVDGNSDDGSGKKAQELTKNHNRIRYVLNPEGTTPVSLNIGARIAKGSYIMRLDAHAAYPNNYLDEIYRWHTQHDAGNTGAVIRTQPRKPCSKGNAIAFALTSPLGVGNSKFRTGAREPIVVDTVPFGFFSKQLLEDIGYYDERLARNQDIELNARIRARNKVIWLIPTTHAVYFCRDTFAALSRNMFFNGYWNIFLAKHVRMKGGLSWRHFVPLVFVLTILSLVLYSFCSTIAPKLLLFLMIVYAATLFYEIKKSRQRLNLWHALSAFALIHISYGLGSTAALVRLINGKIE